MKKLTKKKILKNITRIALVIDRSGSMAPIVDAARNGLMEQINTIKSNADKGGTTYISLISFDHDVITHFDAVNVKKLMDVDPTSIIVPRGTTSLNDAVKKAIDLLSAQPDTDTTANLIIVISDGEENSSSIKTNEISGMIKHLESTGKWTFTFMLANVDIHAVTKNLNLNTLNVNSFKSTAAGTTEAFAAMSDATSTYFSVRSAGITSVNNFYENDNKDASKLKITIKTK
jgi:uncharacterized protein YegL